MQELADSQLISLRTKFGDDRTFHLCKVALALGQYLVARTLIQDEGLAVITNLKQSLELAIKLDNEKAALEKNKEITTNDPTSN